MNDVWVVWPTVSPERSRPMIDRWHDQGYRVGILVNRPHCIGDVPKADMVIQQHAWLGFPTAANILCAEVPGNVVVVVGDDIHPDPGSTAQEIGRQFEEQFPDLMGVMQPTGDLFGCVDRCCVSPWIGREFIHKAYGGKGPFWMGYFHYFCDQELQEYAIKLGCFQQRPDLSQYHDHWQRAPKPKRPKHLRKAKTRWQEDRDLFRERQRKGFPHGDD